MSGGCIVQVWFDSETEVLDTPRKRWHMIETDLPDFATFCELADADRLIGGAILYTRRNEANEAEIFRRVPVAFRGSAVMRCQLPTWQFVEAR